MNRLSLASRNPLPHLTQAAAGDLPTSDRDPQRSHRNGGNGRRRQRYSALDRQELHCLMVDDSRDDRELVARQLRRAKRRSFVLKQAGSISETEALLRQQEFDVLLVDYRLDGEDGTELMRRLGGREAPFPMILLTGLTDESVDQAALAAGASDYLQKDQINPALLERAIIYACVRHEYELDLRNSREELLQAMTDAERAREAKNYFLAAMSHELRTPLNAIIGFSEMIRREMFGPVSNRRYQEYVENIHSSGQLLLEFVNEILELSRVSSDRFHLEDKVLNLPLLIEDLAAILQEELAKKSLALRIICDDAVPSLRADERSVKRILLNLVTNSIKFTPEGGLIEVRAFSRRNRITLTVSDTGPGIDQDKIQRLWEPYEANKGEGEFPTQGGFGLGLSIVKRLVDQHQGNIMVESGNGRGTLISVVFPADRSC